MDKTLLGRHFVKQGTLSVDDVDSSQISESPPLSVSSQTPDSSSRLGEEVKEFYESILSLPTSMHSTAELQVPLKAPNFGCRSRHCCRGIQNTPDNNNEAPNLDRQRTVRLFCLAVQNNHLEKVTASLKSMPDLANCTDEFGWSSLIIAAHAGHLRMVKSLLQHGAVQQYRDPHYALSAETVALKQGHSHIVRELRRHSSHSSIAKMRKASEALEAAALHWCDICQSQFSGSEKTHLTTIPHQMHACTESHSHLSNAHDILIPPSNTGYQMMMRSGWQEHQGLGPSGSGLRLPVKTLLKRDRLGLGSTDPSGVPQSKLKKISHFPPGDPKAVASVSKFSTQGNVIMDLPHQRRANQRQKRRDYRLRVYMNAEDDHSQLLELNSLL